MNKSTKIIGIIIVVMAVLMLGSVIFGDKEPETLIIATTTSLDNSGLLAYIVPMFEASTGIHTKVVAVGTGAALQMGEDGDADVLLVHAKPSELAFMDSGHGTSRTETMYNYFVLVGPTGVVDTAGMTVDTLLSEIHENQYTFVSRGDNSGTHKKEMILWDQADLEPEGDWYVSAGKGMGDTLVMADEMEGFALTDKATYLTMRDALDLEIIVENDDLLLNQYSVLTVNPDKSDLINEAGAQAFVEWLMSDDIQREIDQFGLDTYGEHLFYIID